MSATAASTTQISPKKAASAAYAYLQDLTNAQNIFIEEVELDGGVWWVTLSHDIPGISAAFSGMGNSRSYKLLNVDAKSGEVLGMKIRKLT